MDLTTRVNLVKNHSKNKESNLPVSVVAKLASVNRTSIYYKGTPVSDEELECKRIIDRLHTDNPTWGARQMSSQLKQRGYKVGRRKARRYMDEIKEARQAIAAYIHKYNFERCHSAIGNVPPASVYYPAMLYEAAKEAA